MADKAINWPIKAINNRSKNPEIMEMRVSGFSNNEIGILSYQSEAENSEFHDFFIFGPTINGLLGLFMAYLWLTYGLLMAYLWIEWIY